MIKLSSDPTVTDLRQLLDGCIEDLSEKHRMHRKVRFLFDVRGLLVINDIKGDYVEFGVYRGEMMYAASRILGSSIRRYVGLDTFTGLPEPGDRDQELFVYETTGHMASPKESVERILEDVDSVLIEGDFRDRDAIQDRFQSVVSEIAVAVIDCNWPSSVRAAMSICAPYLRSGSILFLDDYFVATRQANFNDKILREFENQTNFRFREFMTYPPCARAFLVEE